MEIVGRHQGATTIGPVEAQVKEFFGLFRSPVNLLTFTNYLEYKRS